MIEEGEKHLQIIFDLSDNLYDLLDPKYNIESIKRTSEEWFQTYSKTREFVNLFNLICDFHLNYLLEGDDSLYKIHQSKINKKDYKFEDFLKYDDIKPTDSLLNVLMSSTIQKQRKKENQERKLTHLIKDLNDGSKYNYAFDLISQVKEITLDKKKVKKKKKKKNKNLFEINNIEDFKLWLLSLSTNQSNSSMVVDSLLINNLFNDLFLEKSNNFSEMLLLWWLDEFINVKKFSIDFDDKSKYLFFDDTLNNLFQEINTKQFKLLT